MPSASADLQVYFFTYYYGFNPADPAAHRTLMKADGTSPLSQGVEGTAQDGDVVQLGYFGNVDAGHATLDLLEPTATADEPFKGTFIPLSLSMTIGDADQDPVIIATPDGEFFGIAQYVTNSDTVTYGVSDTFNEGQTFPYDISDAIDALNTAAAPFEPAAPGATDAPGYLALRFWDVDTAADGGAYTTISNDKTSKYNTVTDVVGSGGTSDAWRWATTGTSFASLHEIDGVSNNAPRGDLLYEFENSTYVGGGMTLPAQDYATTITHLDDSSNVSISADTGVNNFNVDGAVINAGAFGGTVGFHSAAGNTVANGLAPDFSDGTLEGVMLNVFKTGEGDQILSFQTTTGGRTSIKDGRLILANTGTGVNSGTLYTNAAYRSGSSGVYMEGTASLVVQSTTGTDYEYMYHLTDDVGGNTSLEFGDGNFNVELGLEKLPDGKADFTGTVKTPTSAGNTGTIKVTNLTGWQKVARLSGAGNFQKEGAGVFEIGDDSSAATDFTGEVILNGGTLILGHDEAISGEGIDAGNFVAGKVSVGSGATIDDTFTTNVASTGKTMIGGTGIYANTIVLDDDTVGDHTFRELDPGLAASASLSSVTTPYQSVQYAGETIGSFTADGLTWNDGGIYNWEVRDFTGTAGTDWDLFTFTSGTLDFTEGNTYTIRPFAIDLATGEAGAPDHFSYDGETADFMFLDGPAASSFTIGGLSSGTFAGTGNAWDFSDDFTFDKGFFNIEDDQFEWISQDYRGSWVVNYDFSDSALYLTYSAVPEPSTYVMVLGALFLPAWSFFRRRRSRRKEEE